MPFKKILDYFFTKSFDIGNNLSKVGEGDFAFIYEINEDKVCKIPKSNSFLEIYREYLNQEKAFRQGINVPKPYGVYKINISNKVVPGLVMRNLGSLTLNKLSDDLRRKINKQRDEELEKAHKKGLFVWQSDCMHANNAIYVPSEKKVYLIDCAMWHKKNTVSLN